MKLPYLRPSHSANDDGHDCCARCPDDVAHPTLMYLILSRFRDQAFISKGGDCTTQCRSTEKGQKKNLIIQGSMLH